MIASGIKILVLKDHSNNTLVIYDPRIERTKMKISINHKKWNEKYAFLNTL